MNEATSHLDMGNEQAVNAAIKTFQLTSILVAHRPETIAMAERMVVMAEGKISEDAMQRQASLAA